jgi:hypothetical protein
MKVLTNEAKSFFINLNLKIVQKRFELVYEAADRKENFDIKRQHSRHCAN